MEKSELTALIVKAQSGDQGAMEEVLREAHTSVSYQCRKLLRDPRDAEDITQEVLLTIYTKLDTLKTPEAFWGWLNQATVNRCTNSMKRSRVELQYAEDDEGHSVLDTLEELDEQQVPDKALDNTETTRMIEEIVDGLPEAQRICVLMYYYDEMSVKDIAATLGVPENTVKSRLNYARKAVKEKVLDYEKKGVKLYGLSPLPFMLYFLLRAAEETADSAAADVMAKKAMAAGAAAIPGAVSTGEAVAGGAAAGTGGAAAATGTAVAAETAVGTALTHAAGGLSVKVAAAALAGLLLVGGVAGAVVVATRNAEEPEPVISETVPEEDEEEEESIPMETEPVETEPEETETPPVEEELIPAERLDLLYSFYWGRLNESRMTVNQARAYAEVIERRTAEIMPVDETGVPVSYAQFIDFGNGDPILLLTCGLDYGLTDPDSRMPTWYQFDGVQELWRYVDGRAELFAQTHEIHWKSDSALVLHTHTGGTAQDFTEEVYLIKDGELSWTPAAFARVEVDPNGVNSVDGRPVTPETMWPTWEQLWDRGGQTSICAVGEWAMHDQFIHAGWTSIALLVSDPAGSMVDHGSMDVLDFTGIWNSGLEAAGALRQCAGE